jgi:hypothetical protein
VSKSVWVLAQNFAVVSVVATEKQAKDWLATKSLKDGYWISPQIVVEPLEVVSE